MKAPALKLSPAKPTALRCSMCDKDSTEVRYLMAGVAGGHICDECTTVAMKIVVKQRVRDALRR